MCVCVCVCLCVHFLIALLRVSRAYVSLCGNRLRCLLLSLYSSDEAVVRFSHIFDRARTHTHTHTRGYTEEQSNSLLISLLLPCLCVGVTKQSTLVFKLKKNNKTCFLPQMLLTPGVLISNKMHHLASFCLNWRRSFLWEICVSFTSNIQADSTKVMMTNSWSSQSWAQICH